MRLLGVLREIRSERYDLCLNTVGDVRENILTRLAGARTTLSVIWATHHPFRQLIKPGFSGLIRQNVEIPIENLNIYAAFEQLAASLGCDHIAGVGIEGGSARPVSKVARTGDKTIAIHPMAGHASREWPVQNWNELVSELVVEGHRVVIVGDPAKRKDLEQQFATWRQEHRVSIETRDVSGFLDVLRQADVFIGLDSFGVHAAYSVGVPIVMINGSNDPRVWAPPGTVVLGEGGGCTEYPCYNRPKCIGTDTEYVCVRSVRTMDVMGALTTLIRGEERGNPSCGSGNRMAK